VKDKDLDRVRQRVTPDGLVALYPEIMAATEPVTPDIAPQGAGSGGGAPTPEAL